MNQQFKESFTKVMNLIYKVLRQVLFRLHGCFHKTVTINTMQGRMTMSTRDFGIAIQLFSAREYEYYYSLHALKFLKSMNFIHSEDISMIDIGANIGIISIGLILANEINQAIAIEPESVNYNLLLQNVKQNRITDKLICLQMAAGETESTLTMELSPCNPGDHRIRKKPVENAAENLNESSRQTVKVKSYPLPRLLEQPELKGLIPTKPSLIWIDVQGYEGYVFSGGREILKSGIPTVSEIWPYGILRAGMSLEQFKSIVSSIWSDYWVERRERFIRYPIDVFDRYLDELGSDGHFENVIFTKVAPLKT